MTEMCHCNPESMELQTKIIYYGATHYALMKSSMKNLTSFRTDFIAENMDIRANGHRSKCLQICTHLHVKYPI